MYCKKCGAEVSDQDVFCAKCGFSLPRGSRSYTDSYPPQPPISYGRQNIVSDEKNGIVVLLLAFFLGYLGIHSFYAGKTGIGICQLVTLGGLGIWVLIDIIMLVTSSYRDGQGRIVQFH